MGLRNKKTATSPGNAFMGTQQAAVWLGRSLSTHDVMIRVTGQLMDIITVQQYMIAELQKLIPHTQDEALELGDQSNKILNELNDIRAKIDPVLKMVDQSCTVLEKMVDE